MTNTSLSLLNHSYFAGLFDGEGWFRIVRAKKYKVRYSYQAYAHLCMREEKLVKALAKIYGGTITTKKPRNIKHSIAYQWNVTGFALDKFIKLVGPLLVAKQKQVKVINRARELSISNGNKHMTEASYKEYSRLHSKITKLNKKGIGK